MVLFLNLKIDRHIEFLSQKDLSARRAALKKILSDENINFSLTEKDSTQNFAFNSGESENQVYLFSAHYDNFRGSCGANDNMAAVCILIDFFHELKAKKIPAFFLFTDAEENNHAGAKLFAENNDMKKFKGIINLDLCGYGDNIVISGKGCENKSVLKNFTNKKILSNNNAQIVKYLPESDEVIFRKFHVPALNISIVPKWDVQYLKALASFGERILGMPPEFDMIFSQMEINQTIHGGFKDKPEFIQEEAMMRIYNFLVEAILNENNENNFSEKFSFWNFLKLKLKKRC